VTADSERTGLSVSDAVKKAEDVNTGEVSYHQMGYWHQRADERHGNPPPR